MTEIGPPAIPDYTAPQLELDGFHCPHAACGVYSRQRWFRSAIFYVAPNFAGPDHHEDRFWLSLCDRCGDVTLWRDQKMVFPSASLAARPHKLTPAELLADVKEAREIVSISPRGAAALLRLGTEKLAKILVEKTGQKLGKNLDANIGILVKHGLPKSIQQALDALRVIGNEAVHPGVLDLKDDLDTALRLFKVINVIIDNQIAEPEAIKSLYESKVPDAKKEHIDERDGTA